MKSMLGSWFRILNLVKMPFPTNWSILNAIHSKPQQSFFFLELYRLILKFIQNAKDMEWPK